MYLPSKNKQLVYPCVYSPPRCLRHPPLFFLILHLTFNKKRCCGNYIVESCPRPCPSYWIFLRCSHLSCICISCGNQHVTNKKGKNAPQPLSSWWFTAWKRDSFFRQLCFFCIKEDGWCVLFFFASRHSLHPSSPITLKNGGGNERFNERNGAIDPPFILMGHRSQSITGLLILLLKGEGGGQGEVGRGREGVWQVCWEICHPIYVFLACIDRPTSFIISGSMAAKAYWNTASKTISSQVF